MDYVKKEWNKEARLMAARGDLYVEMKMPHHIIKAQEDIVKKDPDAIAASRIFSSLAYSFEPSCSDISDVDELWGFLKALRGALDFARRIDLQEIVRDTEADAFQSVHSALRSFSDEMGLANVQVQDFGGVDELRSFLNALQMQDEFAKVASLGIVCDTERFRSPTDAFRSVCKHYWKTQGLLQGVYCRMGKNLASESELDPFYAELAAW